MTPVEVYVVTRPNHRNILSISMLRSNCTTRGICPQTIRMANLLLIGPLHGFDVYFPLKKGYCLKKSSPFLLKLPVLSRILKHPKNTKMTNRVSIGPWQGFEVYFTTKPFSLYNRLLSLKRGVQF